MLNQPAGWPAHGAKSPNEMYTASVAVAGHVPVTLSGDDYIELLPRRRSGPSTATASASTTAATTAPSLAPAVVPSPVTIKRGLLFGMTASWFWTLSQTR